MPNNLYDIVSIIPANSGFGAWQVSGAHTGDLVDYRDYISEIQSDGSIVYQLGKDILPSIVDDIRGLIQDQPDIVFAVVGDGNVYYFGANQA
jgi:hypothetical protein